jgi:hypothetical protein
MICLHQLTDIKIYPKLSPSVFGVSIQSFV